MEGVHSFYGKKHFSEPIRIMGQGVAYVARYPTASVGFWRRTISAGVSKRVIANHASWAGAVDGVAAVKGWWLGRIC